MKFGHLEGVPQPQELRTYNHHDYSLFMGDNPQESLENTINTMGTLLGVLKIDIWKMIRLPFGGAFRPIFRAELLVFRECTVMMRHKKRDACLPDCAVQNCGFFSDLGARAGMPSRELTLSPKHGILKMIFLFPRWDMLVPWRVYNTILSNRCMLPPAQLMYDSTTFRRYFGLTLGKIHTIKELKWQKFSGNLTQQHDTYF